MIEFIAGMATLGLALTVIVAFFPRWLLASEVRKCLAEGWDEGYRAGQENVARSIWEDGDPLTNPYRKVRGGEDEDAGWYEDGTGR